MRATLIALAAGAALLIGAGPSSKVQRALACKDSENLDYSRFVIEPALKRFFRFRDVTNTSQDTEYTAVPRAPITLFGGALAKVYSISGDHSADEYGVAYFRGNLSKMSAAAEKFYGNAPRRLRVPYEKATGLRFKVRNDQQTFNVWMWERGGTVRLACE